MAKFINVVTGNTLETEDPLTISLMTNNERYKAVAEVEEEEKPAPAKKTTKKAASVESD